MVGFKRCGLDVKAISLERMCIWASQNLGLKKGIKKIIGQAKSELNIHNSIV